VLKNRNILFVVLARFVSRVGGSAAFFIGTWGMAAYTFHASATTLAWVMAGNSIAAIIGSMAAGVFIDRFGPRRVLIVAEILTIPAAIALYFAPTFAIFVPLAWLFGLVGTPTFTAGSAFAPYLVSGRDDLESLNALIEGAGSLAFVLGPAFGAVVASWGGPRMVFLAMAVASVGAAFFAWLVHLENVPEKRGEHHAWRELKEGLRVSYSTASLRYCILTGTVVWMGFGAFSALEPLFYRDVVKVGVEWIGWINSAFGVGLVSGAALLPRLPRKIVSAKGLALLTALTGLGSVLYVGSTDLRLIAAGGLAWGLVIGALDPLLRTLLHLNSPHEYVGRIVGTAQYHRNFGELVPLAIAPTLAVAIGVQPTLIIGGLLVSVIALASLPVAFRVDRLMAKQGLIAGPIVRTEPTVGLGDEIL
jgi:MFS transporter, DHA3 family, macrolide efflux protein